MLNIFGDVRRCSGEAGTVVQNSRFFGFINASAKSISIIKFKMTGRAGPRLEAPTKLVALSFKGRLFVIASSPALTNDIAREIWHNDTANQNRFSVSSNFFEKTKCNTFSCLSWLYRYSTVKSSVNCPRPHYRFMESRYMTRTRRFYHRQTHSGERNPQTAPWQCFII